MLWTSMSGCLVMTDRGQLQRNDAFGPDKFIWITPGLITSHAVCSEAHRVTTIGSTREAPDR